MQEKSEVEFIEYEPQHKLATIPDGAETDALEIDELKKAMKELPKLNNSYNFFLKPMRVCLFIAFFVFLHIKNRCSKTLCLWASAAFSVV
ncbi:MAG: hypothetical protein HXN53_02015 [Prevotella nigrescens]|nr:hypothetical protein [Prevotella nigrescens]